MKSRIISIFLVAMLIMTPNMQVFAATPDVIDEGITRIAHIKNINSDGTSIGNDISNSEAVLSSNAYDVNILLSNTKLELYGEIENVPFSVSGTIATTNENSNLLLYQADTFSGNFKTVYMSVERELDETALYFLNFHKENPIYKNVIKLYLQPLDSEELIYVEIFITNDFVTEFLQNNNVDYDADLANVLQSWFTSFYEPLVETSDNDAIAPASATSTRTVNLSKTYTLNGSSVTYKFIVNIIYNVPDISKKGNGTASFGFEIATSKTTSDLSANNSSTQSMLRLENLNITVTTYPNIICASVTSVRNKIQKNGSISNSFSVSFGYSYGPVSTTASISCNKTGKLTSNSDTKLLSNTDSKGTRKIETGELPSNYYLQKKESQYGFNLVLQDLKGTARTGNINAVFDYYVNNLYKYSDSKSGTRSYSLSMSVN